MQVQPVQLQPGVGADPGDGLARLVGRQAEFGLIAAGGLRFVGVRRDPRDDPDQYPLRAGGRGVLARQLIQAIDVVEVVDHDGPYAGLKRHRQLRGGLGVPVQVEAFGRDVRGQGHHELAGPGHVDGQSLSLHELVGRQAGERFGREDHLGARVPGREAVTQAASLVPEPRLVDDVRGCPEPFGESGDADAADDELSVRSDRAVFGKEREQVLTAVANRASLHRLKLARTGAGG